MTSIGGHLRELVLTMLRTCNIGWLMIHLGSMETRWYLSPSDGESGDWAGCGTGGSGPGDLALSSNQMWQWDMWHPLWAFRFGLPKSISDSLNNHASHLQTMIYQMRMSGNQSNWGPVRSGDRTLTGSGLGSDLTWCETHLSKCSGWQTSKTCCSKSFAKAQR